MKKILSLFLALICVLGTMPTFANKADRCADYLGEYYNVLEYDFENSAPSWGTVCKDVAKTNVLKPNDTANILNGNSFVGKTYFSFDLMADDFESFDFLVNEVSFLHLAPNDVSAVCTVGTQDVCDILKEQWINFEILFNTFSNKANVTVTSPTGVLAEREISLDNSGAISAIGFGAQGNVYIDNVKMSRTVKSFDSGIVITGDGKYIGAFSENSKGDKLYLAQFRNGNLTAFSSSGDKLNSLYAETYICADVENGDVFKAFLWKEDLTPQKVNVALSSENIEVTEIKADGSILADDVKIGQNVEFSVLFANGYSGDCKVVVYSENGEAEKLEGKSDAVFSFVPAHIGDYTAFLYAEKDGRSALAGKCEFSVVEALKSNTILMFPADKNYYVSDNERINYDSDNYVPLMLEGHVYMSADRIKKIVGVQIDGSTVSYLGNVVGTIGENGDFSVSVKQGLYSVGDICSLLGYKSEMQSDVLCIYKGDAIDIFDYRDVFFDSVANIEASGYYDWDKQVHGGGTYDAATGVYTAKAVQSNFAGHCFRVKDEAFDGMLYEVSFEVKYSDDSENVMPWVGMYTNKNGNFAGLYTGVGTGEGKKGEWTKIYSYFTRKTIDTNDFDTVVQFVVGVKRKENKTSLGTISYRNVRVRKVSICADNTECEITCDKFASWHTLGDTVTYRLKNDSFCGFESVTGFVYNSNGDNIYEKTVSAENFAKNGWSYTPDRLGYYEVEFVGTRDDGSQSTLVNAYTENYSGSYTAYTLPRRSFAVVSGAAKPMEKRSDLLMLSDSALSENSMKIADMIGFSGIRIHGVAWGDTAGEKGFHKASGKFDWTNADTQINNVEKYGFKNVIANIFATPTWAVSRNDVTGGAGYTSVGMWYKNCYPPDDLSVAREGYGEYAKRYKDVISGIEIWNEPTYGNTAFWYQGNKTNAETEKDFADLTVAASEAIRENAPGIKVYTAGFNQADSFFKELLKQDGYADSFDGVTCHGRYSDPEAYQKILSENNLSDKELLNSEGYYYAYYDVGVAKDYKENNMAFYLQYLKHIKMGVSKITHFSLFDNTPDEKRVYTKGWNCAGLFRDYPYIEPHQGAVAAYNFFETLGNDVSFKGEYAFSNGVRAVAVNTDGKVNLYFWNSQKSQFYMPSELEACVGSNGKIIDFEGNTVGSGDRLEPVRMYFVENADLSAVNSLAAADNAALNSEYIAPYYTADTGRGGESYTPLEGYFTKGALFDRTTFADTDVEPVYNSQGGQWISVDDNTQDITAKFAVSFDDDGMYVKAVVNDDAYVNHAGQYATIGNHDCVRFAVDCYGRWQNSERSEFIAGCVGIRPLLYKYYAADKNEALVENWSPSGTALETKYINIVRSEEEKTTTYKVFVPYSELYPLSISKVGDDVRFALSVTDRDGGTLKGFLSFGMGIADDDSPQVWKYMNLKLKN